MLNKRKSVICLYSSLVHSWGRKHFVSIALMMLSSLCCIAKSWRISSIDSYVLSNLTVSLPWVVNGSFRIFCCYCAQITVSYLLFVCWVTFGPYCIFALSHDCSVVEYLSYFHYQLPFLSSFIPHVFPDIKPHITCFFHDYRSPHDLPHFEN